MSEPSEDLEEDGDYATDSQPTSKSSKSKKKSKDKSQAEEEKSREDKDQRTQQSSSGDDDLWEKQIHKKKWVGTRRKRKKLNKLADGKMQDKLVLDSKDREFLDWIKLDLDDDEWATRSVGILERD